MVDDTDSTVSKDDDSSQNVSEGSVTQWIAQLPIGDVTASDVIASGGTTSRGAASEGTGVGDKHVKLPDIEVTHAQQQLWDRYFQRLVGLARLKMGSVPKGAADEEDVAICALTSFFAGAANRRFPQLKDRHSLWPLLAKITSHKAIDQRRRSLTQKQGGGAVRGNSGLFPLDNSGNWPAALLEEELRPDFLVAMNEQCQKLMERLPSEEMRRIARQRMEGYSNAEIAQDLGVVERTIERKVSMIRDYWVEAVPHAN